MADVNQNDTTRPNTYVTQPTKEYVNADVDVATELTLFDVGTLDSIDHYRLDGLAGKIADLGGAANVVVRLYADVNGVLEEVAKATLTATGTFTASDLKPSATGGAQPLGTPYSSRRLKVTAQFAATPTNASLSASLETSLATTAS